MLYFSFFQVALSLWHKRTEWQIGMEGLDQHKHWELAAKYFNEPEIGAPQILLRIITSFPFRLMESVFMSRLVPSSVSNTNEGLKARKLNFNLNGSAIENLQKSSKKMEVKP